MGQPTTELRHVVKWNKLIVPVAAFFGAIAITIDSLFALDRPWKAIVPASAALILVAGVALSTGNRTLRIWLLLTAGIVGCVSFSAYQAFVWFRPMETVGLFEIN